MNFNLKPKTVKKIQYKKAKFERASKKDVERLKRSQKER